MADKAKEMTSSAHHTKSFRYAVPFGPVYCMHLLLAISLLLAIVPIRLQNNLVLKVSLIEAAPSLPRTCLQDTILPIGPKPARWSSTQIDKYLKWLKV